MVGKIKQLCEKEGTTIKSLEKMLALGNGSIRRWDSQIPSVDKVLKVARHFGVSVEYLVDDKEIPTTPQDGGLTPEQIKAALASMPSKLLLEVINTANKEILQRAGND